MDAPTIVMYQSSSQDAPVAARLLIFGNAIQLYEVSGKNLLLSVPVKGIKLLQKNDQEVIFELPTQPVGLLHVPAGHLMLPELIGETATWIPSKKTGIGRLKWPLFFITAAALLIGGYYLLVALITGFGVQLISPKKEAELGKMIYATIIEQQKIDSPLTELVRQFAAPLQLSEQYSIRLTVLDDDEVNAFAIPGGDIVIYKGILKQMQRPEELVALLGHEASHVNERHSLRNILQEMTGSMVISMVFGEFGSVGQLIAGRANMLRSLSYSRSLEEDADELGMQRMLQNNCDPRGMIYLMDRLEASEKEPALPGFLSTHPVTADRKVHAEKFVREHPVSGNPNAAIQPAWKKLSEAVHNPGNW